MSLLMVSMAVRKRWYKRQAQSVPIWCMGCLCWDSPPVKPTIYLVDVDRPDTWSRYRNGMCDRCVASCCTMPLEVKLSDLVCMELVDPFEAETRRHQAIAKRLIKSGVVARHNKYNLFTLARRPVAIATFWMPRPGVAPFMTSGRAHLPQPPSGRAPPRLLRVSGQRGRLSPAFRASHLQAGTAVAFKCGHRCQQLAGLLFMLAAAWVLWVIRVILL